jgi:hypothetical protein
MDQSTANLIALVNTVDVSVEDLLVTSNEIHKLPPHQRDWEGRMICVARLFSGEPHKAFAVISRLEAMATLIASGELPNGLIPETVDGAHMIAEPFFLAAAKEPICFTDTEPFFSAESFLEFILKNTEAHGHA